jgi:hypothetical protein
MYKSDPSCSERLFPFFGFSLYLPSPSLRRADYKNFPQTVEVKVSHASISAITQAITPLTPPSSTHTLLRLLTQLHVEQEMIRRS